MTVGQRGIHHHGRNLCRSLSKSLDCSKSTPPTGATSRRRPPRGGHPKASAFGRGRLLRKPRRFRQTGYCRIIVWRNRVAVSPRDEFRSNCTYYGEKCRKRLHRTKLSRDLALDQLAEVLEAGGAARYEPLLSESLEDHEREAPRQKLIKIVVESHFLALKVNFEF